MSQFRAYWAALAIAVFSLGAWAASGSSENGPLVIGQVVDLSGPNADFGRDFSLGAKVYFDSVNSSGGINGRRLLYRSQDSAGSTNQGVNAAHALIKDGAGLLFGINGDPIIEAIARDATVRHSDLAIFAATGGSNRLGAKDGVFYLRAGTAQEIEALVAHLAPLGIRSISLASSAEYAEEAGAALSEVGRRYGVKIGAALRFNVAADGPALAAQSIARDKPQAVIVAADTLAVAQFFKRYRSLDQGAFLATTSQVNVRTLSAIMGLAAAHGLIISQVVPDPASISQLTREHKKMMERFVDEPASYATLEGFAAAKTLVMALRRNRDSSKNGLQQNLQREGAFDLGGYLLNFSKGGRASSFVELTVLGRNGQLLR